MGRVKVPMELINDNKKRKVTFIRRKEGMFKKAQELTTLCGVNVSMIICSDHQENPEIFPQDPSKLNELISIYKKYRVNDPGKIKSYGLTDFFMERKNKIEEELAKAKKKNLQAKYPTWYDFLNKSSVSQLKDFTDGVGIKIDEAKKRLIELLNKKPRIQNLYFQGSLISPLLNPSPMMIMTPNGFNSNNNFGNGYYPVMPMDQKNICYDHVELYGDQNRRFVQSSSLNSMTTRREDNKDCYDDQERMRQLEQAQFKHMNDQFMMSGFLASLK